MRYVCNKIEAPSFEEIDVPHHHEIEDAGSRAGTVLDSRNGCGGFVTAIRACGFAGSSVAKGMKKISYKGYRFPPEII
jgi:hypothetical protein